MHTLHFDLTREGRAFKLLNATNGGPWHKRTVANMARSNLQAYKAARIPYSRNHDCGVVPVYGGPYSHDITRIFPNFDADPCDPASYDFPCTDEDIMVCLEADTKVFFRLGQTIEHQVVKHGTKAPKDFQKGAIICEHIIRHYTQGWADGYKLDMPYWEIWNEPDLVPEGEPNQRTWGGTKAQFFDLYEITAKHLKACFPHLKIGGPAMAKKSDWAEEFLAEMQKRQVPIDFFSWHCYASVPEKVLAKAAWIRDCLNRYGYRETESILNEWNYVRGWKDEDFQHTVMAIHGIKAATFVGACICAAQNSTIDMLMYYDTRPSVFNGVFDFYTYETLKSYYALYWYGKFYDMQKEIPTADRVDNIYTLCGVDSSGKVLAQVVHFNEDDTAPNKSVKLDFGKPGKYEIYLVDDTHDGQLVATTDCLELDMKNHSMVLIQEI